MLPVISISFRADRPAGARAIAVPIAAGQGVEPQLPAGLQGIAPLATAAATGFAGEPGATVEFHAELDGTIRRFVLVGIGSDLQAERAGGALVARLLTSGETSLVVDASAVEAGRRAAFAAALAQAACLRSWRFDLYRTRMPAKSKPSLSAIEMVVGDQLAAAEQTWAPLAAVNEGVAFTRTLVTEPANILYPETFVERCRALETLGVQIEVLDEAAMRELGMGALLGVSQGSAREARLLVLRYDGTGGQVTEPTVFVGKGVTFDTGGISLKPGAGMEDMKWDMGGAGAVAGALHAIAGRKARAHVIGVCGLVENMPDGNAQRPGDVVTTMSGQTVEILNTDAEGRLVLCDVITWAQKNLKPKTIVDLATLTGAMIVSLGYEHGGMFSNSDALAGRLTAAGASVGEKLWRMPMGDAYDKLIDSPIADMKNIGPREAGSISAAQFIARFVDPGVEWAHLDIAGMVWSSKPSHVWEKGATGYGVRLLDRFVKDVLEA
jgi:leucyl aminopeptidase